MMPADEFEQLEKTAGELKPYEPPAIIQELDLETRAGSTIGMPNPGDVDGLP